MKKITLHIITLLLLLGSFASCSAKLDPEDGIITKAMTGIIGNWKLEKIVSSGMTQEGAKTWDYSKNNIMYQFQLDGILTVAGDINTIPDYYGDYTIGNHAYTIIHDKEGYGMVGLPYGLKINYSTFWYSLSSKELIIDGRPLDGNAYYLTKID